MKFITGTKEKKNQRAVKKKKKIGRATERNQR